jgi:hypothetical protein
MKMALFSAVVSIIKWLSLLSIVVKPTLKLAFEPWVTNKSGAFSMS